MSELPLMRINPVTLAKEWYTFDLVQITEAEAIAIVQAAPPSTFSVAENLRTKLTNALSTNASYLADSTPSGAQQKAQVFALTRQVDALIKLMLEQLGNEGGT